MENIMSPEFFNTLSPHNKLFFTMERTFDKDFAIAKLNLEYAIRREDILYKEAELKVLVENGSDEMMDMLYTEAKKESDNKILAAIKSVIDTIIDFFKSIYEKISSKVKSIILKSKAKNLTADDFANSKTMNIALNMDYEKKMAEYEAKMAKGEKLIRMVSQKTNVDEDLINGFCLSCQRLRENTPKLVMKAVGVTALAGSVVISFKNYGKIAGKVIKIIESGEAKIKSLKDMFNGKVNNAKHQYKIINAIQGLIKDFGMDSTKLVTGIASILHIGNNNG